MGLSFAQYLAISKIFYLDHGRVLSLAEALDPKLGTDPKQQAQDRIAAAHVTYPEFKPKARYPDDVAAACAGIKPAAIVHYLHHPDSPAADVIDNATKNRKYTMGFDGLEAGAVQAELLKHGFQVRPDFHIVHMHQFYGGSSNIIVGGKHAVEQLQKLLHCQYYLDLISSPDHGGQVSPEMREKIAQMAQGQCKATCSPGHGGMSCRPLHREIGLLLGYPSDEVEEFLHTIDGGFDHLPDVPYPQGMPPSSVAHYLRKGLQ